MNSLAGENGSTFIVNILGDPRQYESFFKTSGITTIDCRLELDKNHTVPGEGHPNEKAHYYWAEKIAAFLTEEKLLGNCKLPLQ